MKFGNAQNGFGNELFGFGIPQNHIGNELSGFGGASKWFWKPAPVN
jgi:hypothetical protein